MFGSSEYLLRRRHKPQYHRRGTQEKANWEGPNNRKKKNGRRSGFKFKSLLLLTSITGMGVWYLTPISDWVTTILLMQIPIDADIALGKSALHEFPYPTIYDPHWTPLLKQIGNALIDTLKSSPNDIVEQIEGSNSNSNIYFHPLVEDFVEGLSGETLITQKYRELTKYKWDFAVVKAPIINAFALPGGYIRVTDQLLESLSPTRGEVAALLGHEIGHVLCRHSQARIVQQKMLQLVISALTYEDHDDDEESFGEAMGELLLNSANWFGRQSFSRKDEYQADATGWALLVKSQSYNPQSVQSLLTKLWSLQGKLPTTLDWMSTHPATEDRIEALEHKWQKLNRREQWRLEFRPI